jgi:uncharacterized protein YggE
MRSKSLFVLVVLLLVGLLSGCAPAGPTTVYTQPTPRTLTVNGAGTATLTPDIAYIYIGVHTEGKTAADAVAENTANTSRLVDALVKFGVERKDISTSNFSIWPNQQYDPQTGQQIGTTYVVDNSVYVKVRKLDKLGELLDTAIQAGANTINSIQFDVADKSKALSEARTDAVKNAKAQAEELAQAVGVKLGEVQSISFYDSMPYPVMDAYAKGMGGGGMAAEAAVPIEPGQLTITVTVTIAYEIK